MDCHLKVCVVSICCAVVGRTPLHLASSKGHMDCCESLVIQGATVMVHDSITKRTPLHSAGNNTGWSKGLASQYLSISVLS